MNDEDKLIFEHKNLIENEVRKYTHLPIVAVQIKAYDIAREAAKKYDPKSNAKFSTFLTNELKKLSRFSTSYGSTVRLPEGSQWAVNKLNKVENHLLSEFGRPPTASELADSLGIPLVKVNNLLKRRKKDVGINNITSQYAFLDTEDNDDWLHFVYHDLSPSDKLIFEHKVGFGNKQVLTNEEIAKKLNMPVSTVAQRVRVITQKIEEGMKYV